MKETLNHAMARILFFMVKQKEEWLTSAEISNYVGMGYDRFVKARRNLVYLKLINEKKGKKYLAHCKLYKLNFAGEIK